MERQVKPMRGKGVSEDSFVGENNVPPSALIFRDAVGEAPKDESDHLRMLPRVRKVRQVYLVIG